jgi:HAD superfamily hydrolase (TIGR01490 family)
MDLALFDLDHTLLPIDSDYEWGRFLARVGAVDDAHQQRENDRFYRDYQAGTLDIAAFLAFQLAPLGAHPPEQLRAWHDRFMAEVIDPALRPSAQRLVEQHRERGDLCVIITATNEFVTAPIARRFGIEHLIATQVEREGERYTGRPSGTPSFREGKVIRLDQWLAGLGSRLTDYPRSTFYSDSANDIALLERVTDPVATNPDDKLAAHARARGWRTLALFE